MESSALEPAPVPLQESFAAAPTPAMIPATTPFSEADLRKAGLAARDLASLLKVTWLEALDPPFAEAIERRLDRVLQELPVLEALLPTGAELDSAQLCSDFERLRSICQACIKHAWDLESFDGWLRTPEGATIRDGVLSRIYRACRDLKNAAQQALELLRPVAPPVQPSEVDAGSGEGSTTTLAPAPEPPPAAEVAPARPSSSKSKRKKKKGKRSNANPQTDTAPTGHVALTSPDETAGVPSEKPSSDVRRLGLAPVECPLVNSPGPCELCIKSPQTRAALDSTVVVFNRIFRDWTSSLSAIALHGRVLMAREALAALFKGEWGMQDMYLHTDIKTMHEMYTHIHVRLIRESGREVSWNPASEEVFPLDPFLVDWAPPTDELLPPSHPVLRDATRLADTPASAAPMDLVSRALLAYNGLRDIIVSGSISGHAGNPLVRQNLANTALTLALLYRAAETDEEVRMAFSALPDAEPQTGIRSTGEDLTVSQASTLSYFHTQTAVRLRLRDEQLVVHPLAEVNQVKYAHHVLRNPLFSPHWRHPSCSTLDEALDYTGTLHVLLLPQYRSLMVSLDGVTRERTPFEKAMIAACSECFIRLVDLMGLGVRGPSTSERNAEHKYDTYRLAHYLGDIPHGSHAPELAEDSITILGALLTSLIRRVQDAVADRPVELAQVYPAALVLQASEKIIALERGRAAVTGSSEIVESGVEEFAEVLAWEEDIFADLRWRQQIERARRRAAATARSSSSRWIGPSPSTATPPLLLVDAQLQALRRARDRLDRMPQELGWPTYRVVAADMSRPVEQQEAVGSGEELDKSKLPAGAVAYVRARSTYAERARFDSLSDQDKRRTVERTAYIDRGFWDEAMQRRIADGRLTQLQDGLIIVTSTGKPWVTPQLEMGPQGQLASEEWRDRQR